MGIKEYERKIGYGEDGLKTILEENLSELTPSYEENYILDRTRAYHNLLQNKTIKRCSQAIQSYVWDFNVAYMEEGEKEFTYLQDELGSTIRLLEQGGESQAVYGYDEFGEDTYNTQGRLQPFGYTGYRYDKVADTYFAQAREYVAGVGRFAGEDWIKGSMAYPYTLNSYGYCYGNPMVFVDIDGKTAKVATLANPSNATFNGDQWDSNVSSRFIQTTSRVGNRVGEINREMNFKSDPQGMSILFHYLYGNGVSMIQENGSWSEYLKADNELKERVKNIVYPLGEPLKAGQSIELNQAYYYPDIFVANGEAIIGYNYFHGPEVEAGGFVIEGKISKIDESRVEYDLHYIWNDRMDPNFMYSSDKWKAKVANIITMGNAKPFLVKISWDDKTVIDKQGGRCGWLSD